MATIIETMPTVFGTQLYPEGCPVPADFISVNGKSVMSIFVSITEDDKERAHFEKILEDYYRYYLLAPCWKRGEITEEEIMSADGDRLFEICMDLGLDPL